MAVGGSAGAGAQDCSRHGGAFKQGVGSLLEREQRFHFPPQIRVAPA